MSKAKECCPLCGGDKEFGKTTFAVDLGFGVVVVRNVPAQVCSLCGEDWIDDPVAERLEVIVEHARGVHAAVDVSDFSEKVA
ncbi:type II toxin-antitoxin system MqsA family antitoxin [Methylococcus sp. EFPC2]|uniref:type II toxin-antitoxin system MqsA family antitoxin n=1 Tax=Methylococcus sp. EFPC2 TaxID=2812648 RepID=UPI0019677F2F|nr:type II toxin-antitoxin system MqsA family antitoxin [Methylococcus sp. EFPC2]QSA96793.1 type II toxin-antitoxin system MqsA family antitoxin [Methylococcus sp. EFPC2]